MDFAFALPKPHPQLNGAVSPPHEESTAPPPLPDLVAALDRATQAAKFLSSSSYAHPFPAAAIASLRDAHQMIGSFLASAEPQPSNGDGGNGDEPMSDPVVVEEVVGPDVGDWSRMMEDVEQGLRECVLQTKRRRKRRLPPLWPPGRVEEVASVDDAVERRRSAIDLVFQFHA